MLEMPTVSFTFLNVLCDSVVDQNRVGADHNIGG